MSYYNEVFRNWQPERAIVEKPRKNRNQKERQTAQQNKTWKHRKEKARREWLIDDE